MLTSLILCSKLNLIKLKVRRHTADSSSYGCPISSGSLVDTQTPLDNAGISTGTGSQLRLTGTGSQLRLLPIQSKILYHND